MAKVVCEDAKWVDLGPVPGTLAANRVSGEPFSAKFEAKMPDRGLVVNTYLNKLSSDVETDADTPIWIAVETADFAGKRAPGGGFELDGGFAFVGCLSANAQNRGCGVKQAAHTARAWAVDVSFDHRGRYATRLLVETTQESRGTRMFEQTELAQQGKGIASGIAHGCGAARQRPGAQVRGALKIGKAGDKKLAAPNGSVGAGARAIKSDAKHTCIGRKLARGDSLGHHARDVRVMVLDFDKWQALVPGACSRAHWLDR